MKKYDTPEIEVTTFTAEAVLLTSGVGGTQDSIDEYDAGILD